jgi:AAA+ superfamily predicted ATPase
VVNPAAADQPNEPAPNAPTAAPAAGPALPEWYPGWVRELAERFYAGTACLFVLHGNVHDLVRAPDGNGGETYVELGDVLATKVFGNWDLVVSYDLARGLRPSAGTDAARARAMTEELAKRLGDPEKLSRDPGVLLPQLDRLIDGILFDRATPKKRLVMLFPYAQHLVPEGDLATLAPAQEANLIRFLNWAQNPYIKRENMIFCLIADRLSEVNDRLGQSAHVATIAVPLPDRDERLRFINWFGRDHDLGALSDFAPEQLAELTNGLNLYNLQVLLSQGVKTGRKLDAARFRDLKKERIEQQCGGLLEFVEPKYSLDMLVGQEEAKARLRQDAALIAQGALDAVPMGYLVCGPVGTGKSFLAECFAGSIGIPCVTLKNFRSKYVGETEGNLEQVLGVLRSLGPVVVVIDEADAALGTRQAEGDSGTSSRVFAMIARQMGDTRYRGQILWMLLTSRPDLLPIDLKRQGRAEVHIPLFYPQSVEEVREMFTVMARKNRVSLAPDALKDLAYKPEQNLSGSDLESILIAARRRALAAGRTDVAHEDLKEAYDRFLPSAQGLEKEMQEIAAVLECTDMEFLPEDWRKAVSEPEGRRRLQERHQAIRQILREG